MAQHEEPMDIDSSVCDFDDKENSFHHNNVPRTPCTEKGYEELDVSELNMKLRYSETPVGSPMSKSYTATENKNFEFDNNTFDCENGNMTRSLHTTFTKNDTGKMQKTLPLQTRQTDFSQIGDANRNVLQPIDAIAIADKNGTINVTRPNDIDENISLPSSSSSMAHTPEATTPTKEIPKSEGSPIMRGLKSVINMFRPSQSPIPSEEDTAKLEISSPPIVNSPNNMENNQAISISTPLVGHTTKYPLSRRTTPNRDSVVFNDDLEKELEWKEDSTVIFSHEKVPIHKLFPQIPKASHNKALDFVTTINNDSTRQNKEDNLNSSVEEYMDISYNDTTIINKTAPIFSDVVSKTYNESDCEFVDCETTFNKDESFQSPFNNDDLSSTKDILSFINDLVEQKTHNDTLNASDAKSADLSAASIETTKHIDASGEICLKTIQGKVLECVPLATREGQDTEKSNFTLNTTYEGRKKPLQETLETITMPAQFMSSTLNASSDVTTVITQNKASRLESLSKSNNDSGTISDIGIKSLSQIPLIVDPRVLLFNIPSLQDGQTDTNSVIESSALNNSPADIPLPDDDDVPSLPVMNSELENISHKLDEIAEEIPKINQHGVINESSIESVDSVPESCKLNDKIKRTTYIEEKELAPLVSGPTEITMPQEQKEYVAVEQPSEGKVLTENKTSELSNTTSADMNLPDPVYNLESTIIPSIDLEEIQKSIMIPENGNLSDLSTTVVPEKNHQDEESSPTHTKVDLLNTIDLPKAEIMEIPKAQVMNMPNAEVLEMPNVIPLDMSTVEPIEMPNIEVIAMPEVEPLDINIIEQATTDLDVTEKVTIAVSFNPKLEIISSVNKRTKIEKDNGPVQDNEIDIKSKEIKENKIPESVNLGTALQSFQPEPVKTNNGILGGDIEFIKQEVEAIIAKAVDIATEKSSNCGEIEKLPVDEHSDKAAKDNVNLNLVSNNFKPDLLQTFSQESLQTVSVNSSSNSVNSVDKSPSEANVHQCDVFLTEEAKRQEMSLNQLSDNKYDYTVHNNVNHDVESNKLIHNETLPAVVNFTKELLSNESESLHTLPNTINDTEAPAIIESNANDAINSETQNNENGNLEELKVAIEAELLSKEDQLLNVTPPDMEKIEPVTDEEISVSENNSPFVLVSHETEDVIATNEIDHDAENQFTSESKAANSPPPSPKIISKGYNFNFDEIDDPFATKTKIRMSPTPGTPLSQSSGQVVVDQEWPKTQTNKNDRRKSQTERKRSATNNKKMNSTFAGKSRIDRKVTDSYENRKDIPQPTIVDKAVLQPPQVDFLKDFTAEENKTFEKTKVAPDSSLKEEINFENEFSEKKSADIDKVPSSEQSIYLSAGTSSEEAFEVECNKKLPNSDDLNYNSFASKSKIRVSPEKVIEVKTDIKLPDLDDPNFNPFATKSKIQGSPPAVNKNISPFTRRSRICRTPPLTAEDEDTFASKIKISPENSISMSKLNDSLANSKTASLEKVQNQVQVGIPEVNVSMAIEHLVTGDNYEEKDGSENISGTTSSSSNDKNHTIKEVNTEDEDTVEGPFLEADDLYSVDKVSEFDGEDVDMMEFSDMPPPNQENVEGGEMFIDAETFDFFLNKNQANAVSESGKESLFLKFDPLFAKRLSSDGVLSTLKQVKTQVKQSTPKKDEITPPLVRVEMFDNKSSPVAGPSNINVNQEEDFNSTTEDSYDDLNVTVSKPMMIVSPAINPVVTPRTKTFTPLRSNRQSLTFTSPAIAVIDRLLSLSAENNSSMSHDTTVAEVRGDNESDFALTQLRELLADKEISVYNLRSENKELQSRLATLESQVKSLETIGEDRLKNINELNEKLDEKDKINKKMAKVVEEYERTIASLITEMEKEKKQHAEERVQLIKDRDEQTAHLASMEVSFSDLHSKYEKSKQVIFGLKSNEDSYKKTIKEFEENCAKMQKNYELLKQHATSKLNYANEELQKINRAHESDVLKLNAMIKRKELHITSLEETLLQKTKANEELTAICDELINKVG